MDGGEIIDGECRDCDVEVDLPLIVSRHLTYDSVAVFLEVGAEKHNYILGYADAINSLGVRKSIDLDDIYTLAEDMGKSVTQAKSY